MSKWTQTESNTLTTALERVQAENRFWPERAHHNLINGIVPLAATEVAVVRGGKLLLQYRLFDEWPVPYNKPGWYIPGGYIAWTQDLHQACATHLMKDLRGEYQRAGVKFEGSDLHWIILDKPVVISVKKWMPGEHPFGCPISLVCVCELLSGDIVETDWLKWSDKTVPTDVPWHRSFQEVVHFYLDSPSEMRQWLVRMQGG